MKREATPFASWTFLATFGLGLVCLTRAALVFWPRWGGGGGGGGSLLRSSCSCTRSSGPSNPEAGRGDSVRNRGSFLESVEGYAPAQAPTSYRIFFGRVYVQQ